MELPMDVTLREVFLYVKDNPFVKRNQHVADDDQDYPFPLRPDYVSHVIKELLQKAGIDATAHDLRDSFVSHLIYLGYPLEDVSKLAGHSSIKVTEKHYYGQIQERRRQMLSDLGKHMRGQTGSAKTMTENDAKERSSMPNLALSDSHEEGTKIPDLSSGIEGWALRDSNPQPTDYESAALPLS